MQLATVDMVVVIAYAIGIRNSPLAADALETSSRRRYLATWHLIALATAA